VQPITALGSHNPNPPFFPLMASPCPSPPPMASLCGRVGGGVRRGAAGDEVAAARGGGGGGRP
jgi:hypothetical protein